MSILDRIKQNAINLAKQVYYDQYYKHEQRKKAGKSFSHNTVKNISNLFGSSPVLGVGNNMPPPISPSNDFSNIISTGGGGVGGDGNGGDGNRGGGNNDKNREPTIDENGNLVDAATAEYNRKKSAILSRLATIKEEARRLREQAKGTWDFTTGEVKKNYDALKKLSGEKLQQALRGLAAEDVDVQNMYGRIAGNARRAIESALMRNRMLHRAMGSLGSSFYLNAQGDTRNQGMNTINDTAVEEAAKRGLIGTAKSKTNTDFAQNDLAISSEEAKLNQDALTEYNNSVANADLLEKNYNIDSTEAIDEADTKLTSSLEAIKKYLSDKSIANRAGTVNTGTLGNFVKSYDAISPIKSTLNTRPNYDNTNQFTTNISKMGIPNSGFSGLIASANNSFDQYNPNSPNYFLRFKKKPREDLNQYYMNLD